MTTTLGSFPVRNERTLLPGEVKMLRFCLATFVYLASLHAAGAQFISGTYGPLHLAVTEHKLAGVYAQRIGEGASEIICVFLLEGTKGDKEIALKIWLPGAPETTTGIIRAEEGGRIGIRLDESMPGCPMAAGELTRQGEVLSLERERPEWIAVGIVTAEAEMLRATPTADPSSTDATLVRYDAVAVLARHKDRFLVEALGKSEAVAGWGLRSSVDVSPVSEP